MTKTIPWQDESGVWHNYPREWHGHWFDNGRPSREARIAAIIEYLRGGGNGGNGDGHDAIPTGVHGGMGAVGGARADAGGAVDGQGDERRALAATGIRRLGGDPPAGRRVAGANDGAGRVSVAEVRR